MSSSSSKSKKYINNYQENKNNPEHATFEISNLNLALVNAYRRVFLAEIPIVTIDKSSITYQKNNSMFDNDFIANRLKLLVFDQKMVDEALENIADKKLNKISLSLDAYNNGNEIMTVYASDIVSKTNPTTTVNLFSDELKNTIITKLKPMETLQLTAKLIRSTQKDSGAQFSAVCWSAHSFKEDKKVIDQKMNEANINTEDAKRKFMIEEADKYYLKNNNGEPDSCIFNLESNGHYPPLAIIKIGITRLINKLKIVKDLIQNGDKYDENSNTLVGGEFIEINNIESGGFEYTFFNEDDTLGNLLQSYLNDKKEVVMAGYNIIHPLKKELLLRLVTNSQKSNKKHSKSILIETITELIDLNEKVLNEF